MPKRKNIEIDLPKAKKSRVANFPETAAVAPTQISPIQAQLASLGYNWTPETFTLFMQKMSLVPASHQNRLLSALQNFFPVWKQLQHGMTEMELVTAIFREHGIETLGSLTTHWQTLLSIHLDHFYIKNLLLHDPAPPQTITALLGMLTLATQDQPISSRDDELSSEQPIAKRLKPNPTSSLPETDEDSDEILNTRFKDTVDSTLRKSRDSSGSIAHWDIHSDIKAIIDTLEDVEDTQHDAHLKYFIFKYAPHSEEYEYISKTQLQSPEVLHRIRNRIAHHVQQKFKSSSVDLNAFKKLLLDPCPANTQKATADKYTPEQNNFFCAQLIKSYSKHLKKKDDSKSHSVLARVLSEKKRIQTPKDNLETIIPKMYDATEGWNVNVVKKALQQIGEIPLEADSLEFTADEITRLASVLPNKLTAETIINGNQFSNCLQKLKAAWPDITFKQVLSLVLCSTTPFELLNYLSEKRDALSKHFTLPLLVVIGSVKNSGYYNLKSAAEKSNFYIAKGLPKESLFLFLSKKLGYVCLEILTNPPYSDTLWDALGLQNPANIQIITHRGHQSLEKHLLAVYFCAHLKPMQNILQDSNRKRNFFSLSVHELYLCITEMIGEDTVKEKIETAVQDIEKSFLQNNTQSNQVIDSYVVNDAISIGQEFRFSEEPLAEDPLPSIPMPPESRAQHILPTFPDLQKQASTEILSFGNDNGGLLNVPATKKAISTVANLIESSQHLLPADIRVDSMATTFITEMGSDLQEIDVRYFIATCSDFLHDTNYFKSFKEASFKPIKKRACQAIRRFFSKPTHTNYLNFCQKRFLSTENPDSYSLQDSSLYIAYLIKFLAQHLSPIQPVISKQNLNEAYLADGCRKHVLQTISPMNLPPEISEWISKSQLQQAPCNFTVEEINLIIAAVYKSNTNITSKNLIKLQDAVIKVKTQWPQMSINQLISMSQTQFFKILNYFLQIPELGLKEFELRDLVAIASVLHTPYHNLVAACQLMHPLLKKGFSKDHIKQIALNPNGHAYLRMLEKYHSTLQANLKKEQYTQLSQKMAKKTYKSKQLQFLVFCHYVTEPRLNEIRDHSTKFFQKNAAEVYAYLAQKMSYSETEIISILNSIREELLPFLTAKSLPQGEESDQTSNELTEEDSDWEKEAQESFSDNNSNLTDQQPPNMPSSTQAALLFTQNMQVSTSNPLQNTHHAPS